MAGTLTIDTLKASSGVLATQNGMTGIAKAWVNYNGTTQTISGSFNVSSVTYNSAGDYTINYTTAMPNATYSVTGAVQSIPAVSAMFFAISNTTTPLTTGSVRVEARGTDQTQRNVGNACVTIHSS